MASTQGCDIKLVALNLINFCITKLQIKLHPCQFFIVDSLNLLHFITMLLFIDLLHLRIKTRRHAHVHILLHCECQIASYYNTVVVPQYQLEKLLSYRNTNLKNRTNFRLLIPLNTNCKLGHNYVMLLIQVMYLM